MNCKAAFAKLSKKQSVKSYIAIAVCVLLIAGSLLSAMFILTHTGHEHDRSGPEGCCATCVYLSVAENLLELLSFGMLGAAFAFGSFSGVRAILKPTYFHAGAYTPVRLKVRINN